jgi:predicted nucleic acid-binding protein
MNLPNIGYLLDTNVISETQKRHPNSAVLSFLESVKNADLYLSVLTIGELRRGSLIKLRRTIGKPNTLSSWIDGLESIYANRIIPVDTAIATLWGELTADRTYPAIDALLAATAIAHDLFLVTRNTADVYGLPVKVINPWH